MQDVLKKQAAIEAAKLIEPDTIVGVGTGSTVNFFIDALAERKQDIDAAVASSEVTAQRLKQLGIPVIDLNAAGPIDWYVDGADEIDAQGHMIKGGGGALTREKIVAAASNKFCCIVDESKEVACLGKAFPVPVEVIPMARSLVGRKLVALGGDPVYREGFTTDNGNIILDVYGLTIDSPVQWENEFNQIPGVVCCGIFAQQAATQWIVAGSQGVQTKGPDGRVS